MLYAICYMLRPYLLFAICYLLFAICYLLYAICYLTLFAISYLLFADYRPLLSSLFQAKLPSIYRQGYLSRALPEWR